MQLFRRNFVPKNNAPMAHFLSFRLNALRCDEDPEWAVPTTNEEGLKSLMIPSPLRTFVLFVFPPTARQGSRHVLNRRGWKTSKHALTSRNEHRQRGGTADGAGRGVSEDPRCC